MKLRSGKEVVKGSPGSCSSEKFLGSSVIVRPSSLLITRPLVRNSGRCEIIIEASTGKELGVLSNTIVSGTVKSSFSGAMFPSEIVDGSRVSGVVSVISKLRGARLGATSSAICKLSIVVSGRNGPGVLRLGPTSRCNVTKRVSVCNRSTHDLVNSVAGAGRFRSHVTRITCLETAKRMRVTGHVFRRTIARAGRRKRKVPGTRRLGRRHMLCSMARAAATDGRTSITFVRGCGVSNSSSSAALRTVTSGSPSPSREIVTSRVLHTTHFSGSTKLGAQMGVIPVKSGGLRNTTNVCFFRAGRVCSAPSSRVVLRRMNRTVVSKGVPR